MTRLLCWINLHNWHREEWSDRVCQRCGHREILMYTQEGGAVWERVT